MAKTCILFDMIGPIFKDGRKIAIVNAKNIGLPEKTLRKILYGKEMNQYKLGKINSTEFWKNIYKQNKIIIPKKILIKKLYNLYQPNVNVLNFIKELHNNKKIELFIFSNNITDRIDYLKKKYNYNKYFSEEFYSYEYGLAKPDIRFYQQVKKKINSKRIIFIDDKKINLRVGRKTGFKCINYQSEEKLIKDIKNLLI
jgi:HAD superfamily hydrolase (TIGR01509 family)